MSRQSLGYFFDKATQMRELDASRSGRIELASRHIGRQLISLFYEPSTRTRVSFEIAAVKLGMGYVSTENAREFSSAAKGETLEDTIRVLNEYNADALVMRHHDTGAAARAATVAADHMSVINAGDGKGEHPTQAILDTYTIQDHFGRLDNLNVVLGGDLRQGRTARSLARLLALYPDNSLTFVSTHDFQMGDDIKDILRQKGTDFAETDDVLGAVKDADVVYWTRLQRERLEGYGKEQVEEFVIDRPVLDAMNRDAIIMHPLPRVGEIAHEVDDDPRAKYFRQAGNGLYTRMALLDTLLSHSDN